MIARLRIWDQFVAETPDFRLEARPSRSELWQSLGTILGVPRLVDSELCNLPARLRTPSIRLGQLP